MCGFQQQCACFAVPCIEGATRERTKDALLRAEEGGSDGPVPKPVIRAGEDGKHDCSRQSGSAVSVLVTSVHAKACLVTAALLSACQFRPRQTRYSGGP